MPRSDVHMRDLYKDLRMPPVFSPTGSAFSLDLPWPVGRRARRRERGRGADGGYLRLSRVPSPCVPGAVCVPRLRPSTTPINARLLPVLP